MIDIRVKRGFTLIEMLCVLCIMVLIATLCLGSVTKSIHRSKKLDDNVTADLYTSAMKSYMIKDYSGELTGAKITWNKNNKKYTTVTRNRENLLDNDIRYYLVKTGKGVYPQNEREANLAVRLYTGCFDNDIKKPISDLRSDFFFDKQDLKVKVLSDDELSEEDKNTRYIKISSLGLSEEEELGVSSPYDSNGKQSSGWTMSKEVKRLGNGDIATNGGTLTANLQELGAKDTDKVIISFVLKVDTPIFNGVVCNVTKNTGLLIDLQARTVGLRNGSYFKGNYLNTNNWCNTAHVVEIVYNVKDITNSKVYIDGNSYDSDVADFPAESVSNEIKIGGVSHAIFSDISIMTGGSHSDDKE